LEKKITTINLPKPYFEVLDELIRLGLADNYSQAIRRCIEAVDGFFRMVEKQASLLNVDESRVEAVKRSIYIFCGESKARMASLIQGEEKATNKKVKRLLLSLRSLSLSTLFLLLLC
jgi:hypothetical protein